MKVQPISNQLFNDFNKNLKFGFTDLYGYINVAISLLLLEDIKSSLKIVREGLKLNINDEYLLCLLRKLHKEYNIEISENDKLSLGIDRPVLQNFNEYYSILKTYTEEKNEEAINRLKKLARGNYFNSYHYILLGDLLIREGRFNEVTSYLEEYFEKDGKVNLEYCYSLTVYSYYMTGNKSKGDRALEKIRQLNSNSLIYYINAAAAKIMEGNDSEGIELLKKAKNINDQHPDIYTCHAQLYEKAGDSKKAIENYEKAIACDSSNYAALLALSQYQFNNSDFKESHFYAEQNVFFNPKRDLVYLMYGRALLEIDEYDQAKEALDKALEIKPNDDIALTHMGIYYLYTKDKKTAIGYYKKALKVNKKNNMARSLYWQARLFSKTGCLILFILLFTVFCIILLCGFKLCF